MPNGDSISLATSHLRYQELTKNGTHDTVWFGFRVTMDASQYALGTRGVRAQGVGVQEGQFSMDWNSPRRHSPCASRVQSSLRSRARCGRAHCNKATDGGGAQPDAHQVGRTEACDCAVIRVNEHVGPHRIGSEQVCEGTDGELGSEEVGSLLETGARKTMQIKRMAVSCTYPKGTGTILSFRAAW